MQAAIQGIPEEAAKRGVFPEDVLRARFLKVISHCLLLLLRQNFKSYEYVKNTAICRSTQKCFLRFIQSL